MRPAVYASVMRNRKSGARRVYPTPHKFSWSRFFVLLFIGAVLFLPGLVVTIIGIENSDRLDEMPGDDFLYKFAGPAGIAGGIGLMCASGIYYCCWGYHSPVSTQHSRGSPIPAISNEKHATTPFGKSRSHGHTVHVAESRPGTVPATPEQRSGRQGNGSNRHRTHSRSSTDSSRNHNHYSHLSNHSSRHRSSSHSHNNHSMHNHVSHNPTLQSHKLPPPTDNQVSFEPTVAPLAQGETGSMDIEIDIDIPESDKKY